MRLAVVVAVTMLAANALSARAACGDDPAHAGQIAAARGRIDADCNCTGTPDHKSFVRCAAALVRQLVGGQQLAAECARDVRRCASRSTCGRPGTVTCCRTGSNGASRCRLRTPERCQRSGGCIGIVSSCCDACGPTGCISTTTTTTTLPLPPCGSASAPACGGTCPPGEACGRNSTTTPPFESCACFPAGATPCGGAAYPQCGGACLDGYACRPVRITAPVSVATSGCGCAPANDGCGPPPPFNFCSVIGLCPPGQVCTIQFIGEPGGVAYCDCGPP